MTTNMANERLSGAWEKSEDFWPKSYCRQTVNGIDYVLCVRTHGGPEHYLQGFIVPGISTIEELEALETFPFPPTTDIFADVLGTKLTPEDFGLAQQTLLVYFYKPYLRELPKTLKVGQHHTGNLGFLPTLALTLSALTIALIPFSRNPSAQLMFSAGNYLMLASISLWLASIYTILKERIVK